MKLTTKNALAVLTRKLSTPNLCQIDNYEEKITVLLALSELPNIEEPLKKLLEDTINDLKNIQSFATLQKAA